LRRSGEIHVGLADGALAADVKSLPVDGTCGQRAVKKIGQVGRLCAGRRSEHHHRQQESTHRSTPVERSGRALIIAC
jgi:hypothetical protein